MGVKTIEMLTLNNVLNFHSGRHQSSGHHSCFLVILANRPLGHEVARAQPQVYCSVLTPWGLMRESAGRVPRGGSSGSVSKWLVCIPGSRTLAFPSSPLSCWALNPDLITGYSHPHPLPS